MNQNSEFTIDMIQIFNDVPGQSLVPLICHLKQFSKYLMIEETGVAREKPTSSDLNLEDFSY